MSVARVLSGPDRRRRHAAVARARGRPRRPAPSSCSARPPRSAGPPAAGETVALGKLEYAKTGDTLSAGKQAHAALAEVKPHDPVLAIAVSAKERKDDVKLGQALHKLVDEDPVDHRRAQRRSPGDRAVGPGRDAPARRDRAAGRSLRRRHRHAAGRRVGYRETIKKGIVQRGRHKKQSGGHGQFGDVVLDIKPLPRSSGFKFEDKITGGVVPRNYIPSVEEGAINALKHGPLGFQVVDVSVALIDGSYHTVDSSDMAFQTAARIGIVEGLAAMPSGAARADPPGRDRLPDRRHRQDERDPVRPARPDSRLRHPRGLGRLGRGARQDAGVGDRRPHHRGAFGDRRRRQLHASSSITWPN